MRTLRLSIATAILLFCASLAHAQNAVVLGSVYDGKGNPMPGVQVVLVNENTGFSRITATGADGSYTIPEVPPADGYKVTALKPGGEQLDQRTDISVNVGDERSILPPLRERVAGVAQGEIAPGATGPGANTPTPSNAPLVRNETTATSLSGVITSDQLRTLPLYNRNFLVLGLVTPNTHDVPQGSALAGASFSVSGQRPTSNNFLLDGEDNNAPSSNQAIPFQVNDSIQEFRVTSSTANAEYGRGQGGIVSVVTKRGSNAWHGSGFGYFGNDMFNADGPLSVYSGSGFDKAAAYAGPMNAGALSAGTDLPSPQNYNQYVATAAANGYCTNSIGATNANTACLTGGMGRLDKFDAASVLAANDSHHAPFDSKQFGGNIGGPLIKTKLFAFLSYEGTIINNPNSIFERVPTAFDRTNRNPGDPNYDIAQKILALYPQSNVVGVPGALEFYKGTAPNYTHVHNLLYRMDYAKSQINSYNLRYSGQLLEQLHDDTLPVSAAYAGNGGLRNAQNQNAAFTWNHTFSPRVLNEMRVGITQFRVSDHPQDSNFDARSLGLPNTALPTILLSGLDTQYSGSAPGRDGAFAGWADSFWGSNALTNTAMLPGLDGRFPMARLGAPLGAPGIRRDTTYSINDGLTWSQSKHAFKFGGEFRFQQSKIRNAGFSRGIISSSNIGEFTSDSETCNVAMIGASVCNQAFLKPSFDYALNQQADFVGLFNSANFAGYMQDSWRISRRVTVNMGGRYEYFGVPSEVNNQIWNYDPAANGLVQQGHTQVFDPYGYQCGVQPTPGVFGYTDAVYRAQNLFVPAWTCNPHSSNGKIVRPDFGDFAPRLGIAWDVKGNGSTVIRAGVGIFYGELPTSYTAQMMFNRPTQLNFANPRYIYGQNFLSTFAVGAGTCEQCGFGNSTLNPANLVQSYQSAASPFGLFSRDTRNSSTPYTRQSNVSLQQQVTRYASIEVGFVNAGGKRLPVLNNQGYSDEWFCDKSRQQLGGGVSQPYCDTFSYFPIMTMRNAGESSYNSAMVRLRVAQWHDLRLNATYTYSTSYDNASDGYLPLIATPLFTQAFGIQFYGIGNPFGFSLGKGGTILGQTPPQIGSVGSISGADTFAQTVTTTGAAAALVSPYLVPQDPYNSLRNDYGPSDFDTRNRLILDYNYDLPWRKTSNMLGGWSISGIFAAQSGQPFTIYAGPLFGELTQRINASNVQLTGNPANMVSGNFTLPSATCGYAQGTLYSGTVGAACIGSSRRNQFTGPSYINFDMALQKAFKVMGEGKELTFRSEFYNLFNRANYNNPISTYSLDGFSVNPDFGKVKSAFDPRQIQFAVRFSF